MSPKVILTVVFISLASPASRSSWGERIPAPPRLPKQKLHLRHRPQAREVSARCWPSGQARGQPVLRVSGAPEQPAVAGRAETVRTTLLPPRTPVGRGRSALALRLQDAKAAVWLSAVWLPTAHAHPLISKSFILPVADKGAWVTCSHERSSSRPPPNTCSGCFSLRAPLAPGSLAGPPGQWEKQAWQSGASPSWPQLWSS